MKKILTVLLSAAVVLGATGCGLRGAGGTRRKTGSSNSSSSSKPVESRQSSEGILESTKAPEESSKPGESGGGILDKISCKRIYEDYAKQIEELASECLSEMDANKKDIEKLADISADGIDKMAVLCDEGIEKMEKSSWLNASDYTIWSMKLTSLYTEKSTEITSAYMSASIGAVFGGFDLGSVF